MAQPLKFFLQSAGYGTVAGAGAGLVSLAFVDRPGDNANNIARGASLGLYAGIIYGLVVINQPEDVNKIVWVPYLHPTGVSSGAELIFTF